MVFPVKIHINSYNMAMEFVSRKARRKLAEIFEKLGGIGNYEYALKKDRDILGDIPPQVLQSYSKQVNIPDDINKLFTDDNVYSWFPDEYKIVTEKYPHGKQWAMRQIHMLRSLLVK